MAKKSSPQPSEVKTKTEGRSTDAPNSREKDRSQARERAREVTKKILNFRGATRFPPDPLTTALIQFGANKSRKEQVWDLVALVANESFTGCAIVVIQNEPLNMKEITIKVGELAPMKAKIVWQKQLEENIFKIGVQYL